MAPTLRVWLLDWLGRLDPAAGRAVAEAAFAAGPEGSADEWALHLRNHAWGDPSSKDLLVSQARAMLEHAPWRADPSAGFQEAFDVFVWAGAVEAVSALARLLPEGNDQRLRQPANLALDRLVLAAPAASLRALRADLGALDAQPFTRAGYFARADLGDAAQREWVEAYYLDPRLTARERDYFLELVPNLNLNFSHNLLSANPAPSREEILGRLRQAEATLESWLADPRFRPWRSTLEQALGRVRAGL